MKWRLGVKDIPERIVLTGNILGVQRDEGIGYSAEKLIFETTVTASKSNTLK